jgi:Carboxypeptidase regulatory-like domain
MKRALSAVLALATFLAYQPLPITAAVQNTGEISGTAVVEGKPLQGVTIRVRNIDNGMLVGQQVTNEKGEFRFIALPAGNYVVETVAPNGTLLGTSAKISLTAGAMLASGITVSMSAAAAAAAGVGAGAAAGAGAAGAGAAAGGGGFFTTTAGIVTLAAIGAGVAAAAVAATGDASPSQ